MAGERAIAAPTAVTQPVAINGPTLVRSHDHKQFRSRAVAVIVGCEKHNRLRDFIGRTEQSTGDYAVVSRWKDFSYRSTG